MCVRVGGWRGGKGKRGGPYKNIYIYIYIYIYGSNNFIMCIYIFKHIFKNLMMNTWSLEVGVFGLKVKGPGDNIYIYLNIYIYINI